MKGKLLAGALALLVLAALIGIKFDRSRFYSADVHALARNVYWESLKAGEPLLSSKMVAQVTVNRANMNRAYWGGRHVRDVVYARIGRTCMFTWTCLPARHKEMEGPERELAYKIAKEVIGGSFESAVHLKNADSYLNPQEADRKHVCWFKTHLLYLGKAEESSRHDFYREPKTERERASLPKRSTVPECQPKNKKQEESKDQPRPKRRG